MYSAFGSFYIPSCIMVFVYIKIYYAARERARRNIKKRKSRRKSNRLQNQANAAARARAAAAAGGTASGSAGGAPTTPPIAATPMSSCGPGNTSRRVSSAGETSGSSSTPQERPKSEARKDGALASGVPPPKSPLPSAMKNPGEGTTKKKTTRFSFDEECNKTSKAAAASESAKNNPEEKEKLLPKKKEEEADSKRISATRYEPPLNDSVAGACGNSNGCGESSTNKQQHKKVVHVLSAVSVSIEDSPLAPPTTAIVNSSDEEPQIRPAARKSLPRHPYGACVNNGLRTERRSIGVSTRPDESSSDNDCNSVNSSKDGRTKARASRLRLNRFRTKSPSTTTANQNGGKNISNGARTRRPSKERREMIDTGKLLLKRFRRKKDVPVNKDDGPVSPTKLFKNGMPKCKYPNITCPPPKPSAEEAERERKRLARKKERRATLILGLIMGSFIACWFPFFFLYSISPVCPICEEDPTAACCVRGWGFAFAFWLGYSNSALNPVIYTVFNKDFRRAFKRILFK